MPSPFRMFVNCVSIKKVLIALLGCHMGRLWPRTRTCEVSRSLTVDLVPHRDMVKQYGIKYFYDITDRSDFKANPDYKGVCHIALAQEGHCKPGALPRHAGCRLLLCAAVRHPARGSYGVCRPCKDRKHLQAYFRFPAREWSGTRHPLQPMSVGYRWLVERSLSRALELATACMLPVTAGALRPRHHAGEVLFGTDSHTCNAGAFGQFATGVGNTDAGFILGTGKLLIKVRMCEIYSPVRLGVVLSLGIGTALVMLAILGVWGSWSSDSLR